MTRTTKAAAVSMIAVCGLAAPALAELPRALGHVPSDAALVVSVRSLAEAHADIMAIGEKIPDAEMGDLAAAGMMLGMPGLNSAGSAAIAIMPDAEGNIDLETNEPNAMILLPVNDYARFMGNFGAEGAGIEQIELNGSPAFAKSIGNGYALLASNAATAEAYAGGVGANHLEQALRSGAEIAESSDVVLLTNMEKFRPALEAGLEELKPQMEFFAGMAGAQAGLDAGQAKQQLEMLLSIAENYVSDSEISYVGLDVSDAGLSVDIASTFRQGSTIAGFFQGAGKAMDLLGRTPNTPFFFAGAFDYSNPGMKKLALNAAELQSGNGIPGMGEMQKQLTKNSSGISGVFGATPNIFGNLFGATSMFYHAEDGAALKAVNKQGVEMSDGVDAQGMKIATSYEAGATNIGGMQVDRWGMQFEADASMPGAMQVQQAMMMMFGPQGGPGGYVGAIDDGMVVTMSQNDGTFQKAAAAAKGQGEGLDDHASIQAIAKHLPSDAFGIGFIGFQEIIEAASGVMAMMGAEVPDFGIDGDMPPLAMSLSGSQGDFRARVFVPAALLEAGLNAAEAAAEMEQGAGGGNRPRY
ncbi:MAG: hypothetical protein AAGB51_02790 [Planctomycetota bacterium]